MAVSKAYNFAVSGFGRYNFKPRNRFFIIDLVTNKVIMVQADNTRWTSVDWSPGGLVARHEWLPAPAHSMVFRGCNTDEMRVLYRTAVKAMQRAADALELVAHVRFEYYC